MNPNHLNTPEQDFFFKESLNFEWLAWLRAANLTLWMYICRKLRNWKERYTCLTQMTNQRTHTSYSVIPKNKVCQEPSSSTLHPLRRDTSSTLHMDHKSTIAGKSMWMRSLAAMLGSQGVNRCRRSQRWIWRVYYGEKRMKAKITTVFDRNRNTQKLKAAFMLCKSVNWSLHYCVQWNIKGDLCLSGKQRSV